MNRRWTGALIGLAMVHGVNAQNEGRQHRLYFDSDFLGQGTQALRALACHENGHAVGLTHVGGTCMVTPIDPGQIGFSGDQNGHINLHY